MQKQNAFLWSTAPVYFILLWIVSSISRTDGWAAFLAGMVAFAALAVAFRRGRRLPLFAAYLALGLAATAVAGLESLFWIAPGVLKGNVANFAYGGYHNLTGGIYQRDDHRGNALRPDCHRTIFWNGFWWRHDANARGFRGPAVDRADVVFLGDSMIYGHGVETDETVAACFAERADCSTANLGQQATCVIQSLATFRQVGMALKPKLVFLCCHPNDIDETTLWYGEQELDGFLSRPAAGAPLPRVRGKFRPRPWWDFKQLWSTRLALPLRVEGAIRGLTKSGSAGPAVFNTPIDDPRGYVPPTDRIHARFEPNSDEFPEADRFRWQAHCHAVRAVKADCDRIGAELIVFDLGYPRDFSAATRQLAAEIGASYSDAGGKVLEQALGGRGVYLPNDGHWTAAGCAAVADALLGGLNANQRIALGESASERR